MAKTQMLPCPYSSIQCANQQPLLGWQQIEIRKCLILAIIGHFNKATYHDRDNNISGSCTKC